MSRRFRLAGRGLAATLLTLGLVGGVPVGLIAYVGWPLPTTWPTLDEMQLALRSGIDPQLVVNTLAVFVWLVWLQLVATLTVEVAAVVRGRTARILWVLPGMQQAAARLVATITLVAASLAPIKAPPALALDTVAATVPYTPAVQPHAVAEPGRTTPPQSPEQELVSYATDRHDTGWGIAERTLGDGRRWQEIRQLNPEQVTADGAVVPGVQLRLPADATNPTPEATEVTVERGDHFWSIAEEALTEAWGRPPADTEIATYWRRVIEANRDRLAPPYDPSIVYPGQVFELPPIPLDASTGPAPASSDPDSEVTVQPGDNLWTIAETALTDAWRRQPTSSEILPYWSQVIAANRHQLVDSDNPSHILPDQTFHLPTVPPDPATASTDDPAAVDDQPPTAEPASSPEAETEHRPDTTPAPADTQPSTAPPPTAAAPHVEEPRGARPEITGPPADLETPDEADFEDGDADNGLLPVAAGLAGLGVIAAGVVALIDRLRRRQYQHRQLGTIPTQPSPETAVVESELRAAASLDGVALVDLALRAVARQIVDNHLPPPHLVGVHLSNDHVKALLWTPHSTPPPGWQAEDDNTIWSLPTTTDVTHLRLLADGTPAPYPTLVTVGHDHHSQLLLDLEFAGAITVVGTRDEVEAACRTIALELAASPIADQLQVVCVGFGSDLADLERLTLADTLDDALLDELEDRAASFGDPDDVTLETRLGPGGDNTYPVVVIDPAASPPPGSERLLVTAQSGRGVAAVVGYPTGDRWQLRLGDGTVQVEPLGIALRRRDLTPGEQDSVVDLVATAKNLDGTPTPPSVPAASNGHQATTADNLATPLPDAAEGEPGEDLEVQVLGTIRIHGCQGHFASRKAAELPVYLALHRDGVEADTIMEALWPGEAPDYNRFNRTTSRARTPLGTASDGEMYLPRVTGGIYRVSPRLGCDLDRFTAHVRQADHTDKPEEKTVHLKAALELVEGTPFTGTGNGYTWAWEEGLVSHAIVAVDNTAHQLAQLALANDDAELAAWAARKGLLSTTRCEECYRNLMRAAIAQNNQTALDTIFTELTTVIDADDGPDATAYLDPETIELYEQHMRSHRRL